MTDGWMDLSGVVVGFGSIGERHARNFLSLGIQDLAVVEPDTQRRRDAEKLQETQTYASIGAALSESTRWSFGIVCTPPYLHVPVAQKLAENGLHLFIEKPISHGRDGLDDLAQLARDKELVSLVGCNLRFHPGIRTVKRLIDEGVIGPIRAARIEAGSYLPEWNPDRDHRETYSASSDQGGGALLDYIHEIDYARWLFGDVSSVSCFTRTESHLEIETEDVAAAILDFESGVLTELHVDYLQRPYSRSCHVIGENGTVRWAWDRSSVAWYDGDTQTSRAEPLPSDWSLNDMYVDEARHFLEHVADGTPTVSPIPEGIAALETVLGAKRSAETGSRVDVGGSSPP